MTSPATRHPHVGAYLAELTDRLAGLDATGREEIVADVLDHIAGETARLGHPPSTTEIDTILAALGEPAVVAGATPVPAPELPGRPTMAIACGVLGALAFPALGVDALLPALLAAAALLAAVTGMLLDRRNRIAYAVAAAVAVVGLGLAIALWYFWLPVEHVQVDPSGLVGTPIDG